MAGRQYAPFIGPSEPLEDRKSSSQRSINLYMSAIEGGGEDKQFVLKSAPGLETIYELAEDIDGYCKSEADGTVFVAAGGKLYKSERGDRDYILLGLIGDAGRREMISAAGYVFIAGVPTTGNEDSYVYNLQTEVLAKITHPDFPGCRTVTFLDGYFICSLAGTSDQFFISAIDDPMTWDALDFSSADSSGDAIVALTAFRGELVIFGSRGIEFWVNSGGEDFPFIRSQGANINIGIAGPEAFTLTDDALYWIGDGGNGAYYVYEMQGHQPVRVSTKAVEDSIFVPDGANPQFATMWTYQTSGHEFVGVNSFPSSSTWVFDVPLRKWHERCELDNGAYIPCRIRYVYANRFGFIHGMAGKKVYFLNDNSYSIDGDPLPRERTWPHLMRSNLEPVSYRSVELACTTGADAPAANITLEVSNDGGYVFGPPLLRSLGAVGRRMHRVRWMMLGASRDRVFRVRVTDPVPVTFHSATVLT